MKLQNKKKLLLFLILVTITGVAQDDDSLTFSEKQPKAGKKFVLGLYIGSLFANQYTASMYDGSGFDASGNKNSFDNSWINQKINYQYGYMNGAQYDQIAGLLTNAINSGNQGSTGPNSGGVVIVSPGTWVFQQSDMPTNMRYKPAISVGLNTRYSVDKMNAIIMNVNASQIAVSGNFLIETPQLTGSTQMTNSTIQTFSILGQEQRLVLNFGYQHLFGNKDANFNVFVEGGLNASLTKFTSNTIIIGTQSFDLLSYFNSSLNTQGPAKRPIGAGFGAFGGIGVNIKTNTKYSAQVVYNPSLERINMGTDPSLKLQNAIGLRFYYNF